MQSMGGLHREIYELPKYGNCTTWHMSEATSCLRPVSNVFLTMVMVSPYESTDEGKTTHHELLRSKISYSYLVHFTISIVDLPSAFPKTWNFGPPRVNPRVVWHEDDTRWPNMLDNHNCNMVPWGHSWYTAGRQGDPITLVPLNTMHVK